MNKQFTCRQQLRWCSPYISLQAVSLFVSTRTGSSDHSILTRSYKFRTAHNNAERLADCSQVNQAFILNLQGVFYATSNL